MEHGTRYCYAQGCGRIECKMANSTYIHGLRERRKKALAENPALKPHGSPSTYINWGCRCDECGEAHSVWLKKRRSP